MIQTAFVPLLTASILAASTITMQPQMLASLQAQQAEIQAQELGSRSMSLNMRYGYELPDNAYKDNILLNMAYISGKVHSKNDINWDQLKKPFTYEFTLNPGERFAYHNYVLPEYSDNVVISPNTNFGAGDGYKYADGLYGMGVCHLASLVNWAAKDAGLESIVPSNHDFFPIPEIPKEHGVAIYKSPDAFDASTKQNLYIKNNLDIKVTFKFDYDGINLKVSVLKNS